MEKTTKLEIRMTEEEKEEIRTAAESLGMKMGPYVLFKTIYERKNYTEGGETET